jgi:type II secretory pathway pseudopilin PulG
MRREEKVEKRGGFSLIEVMVGMLSMAILVIVFSAVLFYGYKGWSRLKAEAALQSDADVVMRTMDRVGRVATNMVVSGNTLIINQTNRVVQFTKSASNLLQVASGVTSMLITNRVGSFVNVVASDGETVSIKLKLVEGSETLDMQYSIFCRNRQ